MSEQTVGIQAFAWSEEGWWRIVNGQGDELRFRDGHLEAEAEPIIRCGFQPDQRFRFEYAGQAVMLSQGDMRFIIGWCRNSRSLLTFLEAANDVMRLASR